MKIHGLIVCLLLVTGSAFSQSKVIQRIRTTVKRSEAEAHLTFLASDEMRGRGTGSPEIAIAANYIATEFKMFGLKMAPGTTSWFQEVGLQRTFAPASIEFNVAGDSYRLKDDLILLKGKSIGYRGELIFAGYGSAEDIGELDIRGKVVVVLAGSSSSSSMREAYLKDSPAKYSLVNEKGGAALIELVAFTEMPWPKITERLGSGRVTLIRDDANLEEMPHLWMASSAREGVSRLKEEKRGMGSLAIQVRSPEVTPGRNVLGWVEGTDIRLKEEVVVVSAHYDHLGVRKNNTSDSIYNGARDNAIGVTAILEAAGYLSQHPAKRSVLFLAACGEEEGLLGSRWYAEHPIVPLSKTVFNLDCDGAGYNDKSLANVVDLGRTTVDEALTKAYAAYGLTMKGDPAPDLHLYERSDNYNFALKGVPALDISPGVKALDDEIMRYYHQPADEVQSLDFDYLEKFFCGFVYSAVLISDSALRPFWKAGDKFEPAGKKLYGMP